MATARGLLMLSLRPMPGMADTDLASGASLLPACTLPTSQFPVLVPLVSGSVRLIPRLMPTTAMVDTVLAMEATAMVDTVLATVMARGLLIPRLMPTMAMVAMVDTAMAGLAMATARGLLMLSLRPMPGMADTDLASGASLLPA